jgi:hypothetical protein
MDSLAEDGDATNAITMSDPANREYSTLIAIASDGKIRSNSG